LRQHLEQACGAEPEPASDYAWTAELQRVTTEADENDSNLRAFGYFSTSPVVSRRTANETDAAQRYVAQTFP
jgi:hypothetical protein